MNQPQALPPEVYARVFENHAEGRQILEELTRRFARPAVTTGGIDAVLQTYQRDGLRKVVEFIVARINQAAGLDISEQEIEP